MIDLGRSLKSAGLEVLMWAGLEQQRGTGRRPVDPVTEAHAVTPRAGDTVGLLSPAPPGP
ncbi:hypothetical protein ACH492_01345 [Streptomyces sp. NPDC019443]|uniref:hypothetical protein n=1 Tax=Streptomyces sp. NPDC019443 TaxID=3365061 RepID=UPI0037B49D08